MSTWSYLTGVSAVGLALGCRPATTGPDAGQVAQLLATDREWSRLSTTSRNADSISAYWTDDARVMLPGQPAIVGKTAIRGMVAGMMQIPGFRISWTPDSAIVSRSGELGYTYGMNEVVAPDSTGKLVTVHARYLTVWRKDANGRWRCVQDYSTPSPAVPGPA